MADPIKWNEKLVLAKLEASYGVDPTPTGAANAIQLKNASFQPMEGGAETRDFEMPYLGGQSEIPTGLHSKLTGEVELVGSGTAGVAPAWGPIALALGMAEVITPATSVVYNPISTGMDSVAVYFTIGATKHVMLGCRGTGTIEINAQKIPVLKFTLTGTFTIPTEEAAATPDFSAFMAASLATTANTPVFTVDSVPMVLESYSLNLGNDVQQRLLIGVESVIIVDHSEVVSAKVEALPLTTFDPFSRAQDPNERFPVNITHGTAAGFIAAINAPNCQMGRLSSYENSQGILMWPLTMRPLPLAGTGNDQFSITLT